MIKTRIENTIFSNQFVELQNNDVDINGVKSKYLRIFTNNNKQVESGTAILCINEKNEILIIFNYRYGIDENVWEIPRGGREGKEGPIETALREIKEEVGINNIEEFQYLGDIHTDTGILASRVNLVLIKVNSKKIKIKLQSEEQIIDFKWIPIIERENKILNNQLKDTFLLSSYLKYKINNENKKNN